MTSKRKLDRRRKRAKQRQKENNGMRYSQESRERRYREPQILQDERHDREAKTDAEKLLTLARQAGGTGRAQRLLRQIHQKITGGQ